MGTAWYVFIPLQSHAGGPEGTEQSYFLKLPNNAIEAIAANIVVGASFSKALEFATVCKVCNAATNSIIKKVKLPIPCENTLDQLERYLNSLTSLESLTFRLLDNHQTTGEILISLAPILSEKLSGRTKFVGLAFDLLETELTEDLTQDLTTHISELTRHRTLDLTIHVRMYDIDIEQLKKLISQLSELENIASLNLKPKIEDITILKRLMTVENLIKLKLLKQITNLIETCKPPTPPDLSSLIGQRLREVAMQGHEEIVRILLERLD